MKKESTIIKLLNEKSATKQLVYSNTKEVFNDLVNALKNKQQLLSDLLTDKSKNVNLDFSSNGEFDAQLKFAGDTLLFHMHSNIFDFPPNHEIHKKKYIKYYNLKSF